MTMRLYSFMFIVACDKLVILLDLNVLFGYNYQLGSFDAQISICNVIDKGIKWRTKNHIGSRVGSHWNTIYFT